MDLLKKRRIFKRRLASYEKVHLSRAKGIRIADSEPAEDGRSVVSSDARRRLFIKSSALLLAGFLATSALPRRADALVMGSTPAAGVVGSKNASNVRINPATEDTLALIRTGLSVLKKTSVLSASGAVHTPASGKKVRVYNTKFSLDTTLSSVSFRFSSGGTDYEKYLAPHTGGLYGTNNHPNYVEGDTDQAVYCVIDGTGNVQVNIDYLEV